MSTKIKILYSEGCIHTSPTVDLVKAISRQMSLDIELETILVVDRDHAEKLNFVGSPTVLVNGRDIDPAVMEAKFSGFG